MGHPQEAAYLAVVDAILEAAHDGRINSTDDISPMVKDLVQETFPEAGDQEAALHNVYILRYLQGFLQVMGASGPMPGVCMSLGLGAEGRMRPVLVATGVVATAVYFRNRDDLAAFLSWVIPAEQQQALGALLKERLGLSCDLVQANQFTFLPEDWERLGVEDVLNEAMVKALTDSDLSEVEHAFRQAVLRRSSPTHLWQMPDGFYVLPTFVPVTVVSSVAPFYWEHGDEGELEMADAIGRQFAEALAAREFMDFEAEVYCGHLHVGADAAAVVADIVEDLQSRGAVRVKVPAQRQLLRLGRNMPCPCGSGKKYKKCCGE